MRTATARRRSGYTHDVLVDTGQTVVIDEPVEDGGNNEGPSPSRLMVAALAACTAITIEMYADRKGWDVGDLEVEVKAEFSDPSGSPSKYDVLIKLPEALDDEQEDRLLTVARKCPVHRALANDAHFVDHIVRV